MRVKIPKELDLTSTLNFCNIIDGLQEDEKYIYDYENMGTVEPFGMLLIGSKIRTFINEKKNCKHADCNFKNSGYAAHMGFFQSVYQDFGKKPGEAKGSSTYIPITQLKFEDMKKREIDIYNSIENTSETIAQILSRSDKKLKNYLSYSTRELIRNVFEHSESKSFWYAGQYWPSKNIVEVAILDEGIGMKDSFKKNKRLQINSDDEAIKLSIQPGISRSGIGKIGREVYDNSGFGLYMISNFCKYGGDLAICSGNKCLLITREGIKSYETSFKGTAIRIRLNSNKLGVLSEITKELSIKGSMEAKEYKKMHEINISSIIGI